MKSCPKCNRKYDDDSLRFCLDDGVPLVPASASRPASADEATLIAGSTRASEPPPTEIMPQRGAPTLKSAGPTAPSYERFADARANLGVRQSNPVLTAGVIAIAVLLLTLVGIAAYFVLRQSSGNESAKANANQPDLGVANRKESPNQPSANRSATPSASEEINSSSSQTGTPLKISATASSTRLALQSNTYYPSNAIDGRHSTAWIEGANGPGIGEWIRFDFDREITLRRIIVQPGYFKSPQIWAENNRLASVTAQFSDGSSHELTFADRMDSQRFDIGSVRTKWVRFVIKSVYYGSNPGPTNDTALSEVAFEWEP